MTEIGDFERDLLYVVAGQKRPRGQAIKSGLETYYDERIGFERLYPELDALVDAGFLERADIHPTSYLLTRRGWQEIQNRHAAFNA